MFFQECSISSENESNVGQRVGDERRSNRQRKEAEIFLLSQVLKAQLAKMFYGFNKFIVQPKTQKTKLTTKTRGRLTILTTLN